MIPRWARNRLALFTVEAALACLMACSVAYAQSPAGPISDLISLEQINPEEYEPAVGEQIRVAYEDARRNPRDAETVGKLGMIFQCYGKYELAETCYRRARALAPRSFRWAYYLGNVEGWLGKYRDAVNHVREALQIEGNNTPARVRLAQLLFESGDVEQSEKTYRESIGQNPRLASAHLGLGRVLAARGDWSGAIESYRRACQLAENYAAAHYALGMAYRKTGDAAKAREHLETYQRVQQSSQPSEDPLMDTVKSLYAGGLSHFAKGSALAQQGKTQQAIAEFESALAINPRLVMAHVNLIAMYGQLDRSDKAEEHFREAVKLDPGWAEVYYNWGLFLFGKRRTAEAAAAFRKALEINPNYADAHAQLGLLLDQGGQVADAQRHYRLALESNPGNRQAQYLLGYSLVRTGQFDEAITHLVETIRVEDEKTPVCMQALAAAYEGAGDQKKALYYIREARQRAMSRKLDELAKQLQRDQERLADEAKSR
jgi:tetratricopeptide (TPR) repeat protein